MTRLPSLGPRGEGWVAIQMVLLALTGLAGFLGPVCAGELRLVALAVGAILMAGGLVLVALGVRHLRNALTPLPYPVDDATLVQTGVYGLVRHPIYGGLIIGSVGWGLLTASPAALVMAVFLLAFFELKSRREEAWLEGRFPEYSAYRARTPRLIPWPGGGRG
ncbi:MAG: isoprenylcysteine carboxylmethyltransferase family protein [Candidatus Limnocylindrales bacterium]|nr:isoprenylcysteine carboxylmethyltransferase family protein [Candidatus Limnocylindrales bacterium]